MGLISTSVGTGGFHLATSSLDSFSSTSAGPFHTVQLGGRNRQTHVLLARDFSFLTILSCLSGFPSCLSGSQMRGQGLQKYK